MESIKLYGIPNPLIVRPMPEGVYEIISGHRRKYAALKLGYRKVPVIIRVLSDEEAVVMMVDANLQRENLLPSEKAFAIKMKYDAIKRNNGRKVKSSQLDIRPTSKVNNIKKYLLAALFNAPSTINGYYQAEVQHDMPELALRR